MKIAFVGGGNMARAIIGGLIAKEAAKATDILVIEPDPSARLRLLAEHGVRAVAAPGPELAGIEVVILAVPHSPLTESHVPHLTSLSLDEYQHHLHHQQRVRHGLPLAPAAAPAAAAQRLT